MVLICTEKEKTTLKNMYDQFDSNSPCIYATTPTLMDSFKPLKTDAPFVADRLRTEYNNEWNKTLTQIGICTNPSTDKKERLITNEVDANNEETLTFAHSFLQMRQQACKELNARFKCNASVSMRLYSVDDEPTQTGTNTTEKDGED
jgi:hypothetical protein